MNLKRFFLLNAMMLFSAFAFSQTSSGAPQNSLPGNEIHDKLFHLLQDSKSTLLPENMIDLLQSINEPGDMASKMFTYRSSILKTLYNPAVSKQDKVFICQHYMGQDSEAIEPIKTILQQHLELNSN